ncbi:putative methyltransferase domain-containing protein [Botrytis fragariae]|uniref:Putative methyltransferase domain-containing protein n=1 Tax=Botrytis fragariae TaxID=1964551 RepID=A0A8H6ECS2_9HELO|nr:putative methyltransferase domain-containing protein [Botrytis fragariae]KAF5867498.1 putative methyltransferase domain-containing protein [Botrytis fragariae]
MSSSIAADQADPQRIALYKGMEARQENEYERLRKQHELHMTAMDRVLIRAPLPKTKPIRILDSATGDGLWMVDALKEFPEASFVGTDIFQKHFEQIQNLPSAITFKVQSVMDEWPVEDQNAYDLVHQRYCLAMFNPEKESAIVKRLFGLVKSGGFIQLVDADLVSYDGGEEHPGMTRMMNYMQRGFTEAGMNPSPGPSIAGWLRESGAVDIQERVLSFPMGCQAATLEDQISTTNNLTNMIDNFAMIGSKTPNYWYTPEEFKSLKEAVVKEMAEIGNTWRFWVVTGQKPI